MDLFISIILLSGLIIISLLYFIFKYQKHQNQSTQDEHAVALRPVRRAVGNRNRFRDGVVIQGANNNINQPEQQREIHSPIANIDNSKIGTKKRAKLEAKAEKKAQREAELKVREQRKKQQEKEDEERKLLDEVERQEEQKREEEKKRLQEEKEKEEEEQYQKMKEAFIIEEEGYDERDDEQRDLLQEFISYIKEQKIVMFEDLAVKFHLKIQTVIDRIEELQKSSVLTGVIDDRGKFIYITMEELQAIANFVKNRGRVTIQELVSNSNNLITLN